MSKASKTGEETQYSCMAARGSPFPAGFDFQDGMKCSSGKPKSPTTQVFQERKLTLIHLVL
jgi:hypothetical protein